MVESRERYRTHYEARCEELTTLLTNLSQDKLEQLCLMVRYNLENPDTLIFPEVTAALLYFNPTLVLTPEDVSVPDNLRKKIKSSIGPFEQSLRYTEIARRLSLSCKARVYQYLGYFFDWLTCDDLHNDRLYQRLRMMRTNELTVVIDTDEIIIVHLFEDLLVKIQILQQHAPSRFFALKESDLHTFLLIQFYFELSSFPDDTTLCNLANSLGILDIEGSLREGLHYLGIEYLGEFRM